MIELKTTSVQKISEVIHKHQRFLVATHVRPDGDAIGSVLALTFMLRKLGKQADPYCQDPAPPGPDFLPGSQDIRHVIGARPLQYQVAVLVDCGDFDRVGSVIAPLVRRTPFLVNIDHHISSSPFGNIHWVEPGASSTCEMLYYLSRSLPVSLDEDIANQLYTGLLTDTGSFRYSNTNLRVMEIAAALVSAGVEPSYVAEQVYDSGTPQRLRLLAQVLSTAAFYSQDRLATAELTQKMFNETSTAPVDAEGFINHLRSVRQVQRAMLFREEKEGIVNVSMRSKGSVDVATFAQRFKGGGHRHAAAFRIPGPISTARHQFTAEALEYLK